MDRYGSTALESEVRISLCAPHGPLLTARCSRRCSREDNGCRAWRCDKEAGRDLHAAAQDRIPILRFNQVGTVNDVMAVAPVAYTAAVSSPNERQRECLLGDLAMHTEGLNHLVETSNVLKSLI